MKTPGPSDWEAVKSPLFGWQEDVDREFAGQSDRAVAIVGVSLLDAHLKSVLSGFFADESVTGRLLAPSQGLGTYSARADIALCLCLITQTEHRNLRLLNRIRNVFAHQLGD